MRRIDKKHMKIEHWYPENRLNDSERLDYSNMLGVCEGHINGQKGKMDTCDTKKGDQLITIDPRNKVMISQIKYRTATGEIYSENETIEKDLNVTLNLNSKGHFLKENRRAVLTELITQLSRKKPLGNWTPRMLKAIKDKYENYLKAIKDKYENYDVNGRKKEYAGIIIWYLDKKIRSMEKRN